CIGISVINSLKLVGFPVLGVIIFNIIIVIAAIILEEFSVRHNTVSHEIIYDDLELLKNCKKQKILKEMSILSGKDVLKYRVRRIDYQKRIAVVDLYYRE
ncbi:MAG TPA: DUF4956 domain-containing protein, partial [Bacteroidales bacterium]|nr:DUF4956 domain-containing protein [Bacteroidales bacterium]